MLIFFLKVLEILYCNKWTRTEGLAALIITPTRELAFQIFETLRKIGVYHDFSAGLIIGKCIVIHYGTSHKYYIFNLQIC